MSQTTRSPRVSQPDRVAMVAALTAGLLGFTALLTGAVVPQLGAGIAFMGVIAAFFAMWHMVSPTTCCIGPSPVARSRRTHRLVILAIVLAMSGTAGLRAQGGPGQGHMKGHMRGGKAGMQDMALIHVLLDNGEKITRTVTLRSDGVETVTESDDPALAETIQRHVASMYRRIQDSRPIHTRDPLFRAIFEHAAQIDLAHEPTAKGIKVIETSTDPYVVKLIQAHAEVLNLFIENGHSEAMKNHDVPKP